MPHRGGRVGGEIGMASAHVPLTLQWQDINLRVSLGKGDQATEKSILTDVSAFAEPGELLAIMGPSGAGRGCGPVRLHVLLTKAAVSGLPFRPSFDAPATAKSALSGLRAADTRRTVSGR